MPTTNINQRVQRLCDLTANEVKQLNEIGFVDEDDLSYAKFVDLPSEHIALIKRSKLETVSC